MQTVDAYNFVTYSKYVATIYFKRTGKSIEANKETLWFTVPAGARPARELRFNISCRAITGCECRLQVDGKLYVEPKSTLSDQWVYAMYMYELY